MSKLFTDASIANEATPADDDRFMVFDPTTGKISYITKSQLSTAIGGGNFTEASGTITSAQVLSANSSPVELLAAPGAGNFYTVHGVYCSIDFNSSAYATNTDSRVRYADNTTILSNTTALLSSLVDYVRYAVPTSLTIPINNAIQFFVPSGNPTAGDSDVKYKIWYTIETI